MRYYFYFKTFSFLDEATKEISSLDADFLALQEIRNLKDLETSKLTFSFRNYGAEGWSAYGYSPDGTAYFWLSGNYANSEIVAHFAYYGNTTQYMPKGWEPNFDPAECLDLNEVAIIRNLELLSLSLKWTYTTQGCIEFCALLDPTKAIFSIKRWHNEIAIGTILAMAIAELRYRTFDYYGVPMVEKAHLHAYEGAYRHALQAVVTACCEALSLGCVALGVEGSEDIIVFRSHEDLVEE